MARGKTTVATYLEPMLMERDIAIVDGDTLRKGLCSDLGFSMEDRRENIRRAAEVCSIVQSMGKIVIACFITPTEELRSLAKEIIGPEYKEVYVKCPLEVCQERDPKGLYEQSMLGLLKGMTGIDSPFEEPQTPDIIIDTSEMSITACCRAILKQGLSL